VTKFLILILLLSSCAKKSTPVTVQDAQDDFLVSKLFKYENCTLYRFMDDGSWHYFSNCGEVESNRTESCGKNCTRHIQERIGNK
jgi:hypothetical protein